MNHFRVFAHRQAHSLVHWHFDPFFGGRSMLVFRRHGRLCLLWGLRPLFSCNFIFWCLWLNLPTCCIFWYRGLFCWVAKGQGSCTLPIVVSSPLLGCCAAFCLLAPRCSSIGTQPAAFCCAVASLVVWPSCSMFLGGRVGDFGEALSSSSSRAAALFGSSPWPSGPGKSSLLTLSAIDCLLNS